MATSGVNIARHPVHSMLVVFPIAFWVAALIGDIAYVVSGVAFWYSLSFVMIGLGIVFGLAAAVFGAIDYFSMHEKSRGRRLGLIHGGLNVTIVILFVINFLLRSDAAGGIGVPPAEALAGTSLAAGIALTVIAVGLLAISGWLGGEMVYVERVGVEGKESGDAHYRRENEPRVTPVDEAYSADEAPLKVKPDAHRKEEGPGAGKSEPGRPGGSDRFH